MNRRAFIGLIGAAAWPLVAHAQSRRLAVLIAIAENDPQALLRTAAIRQGLQERGWTDIRIDTRFSAGDAERLRAYARELLELRPDVFFAGNTSALAAAYNETRTVPIVFAQVEDPGYRRFRCELGTPGRQRDRLQQLRGDIPFEMAGAAQAD
jgi:putative ABC transport system substrate-binding protein